MLGRNWWRLTPEGAEAFRAGMGELQRRLGDAQAPPEEPTARTYELLIGFYPVLPREESDAGAGDSAGSEDDGDAPSGSSP